MFTQNLEIERQVLEQELQEALANMLITEERQRMRLLFHKMIVNFDAMMIEAQDEKAVKKPIPLPAPRVVALLPARVPERLPAGNEYRKVKDAADTDRIMYKTRQAEQTRAHYEKRPDLAKRGAAEMGVPVWAFIEAMATGQDPLQVAKLEKQHAGLYRRGESGGRVVRHPGQRVYVAS